MTSSEVPLKPTYATKRPSSLMLARAELPPRDSVLSTLSRSVVPPRVWTKVWLKLLVSPGTSLSAIDVKTTERPSPEMLGSRLQPLACVPSDATLSSVVTPAAPAGALSASIVASAAALVARPRSIRGACARRMDIGPPPRGRTRPAGVAERSCDAPQRRRSAVHRTSVQDAQALLGAASGIEHRARRRRVRSLSWPA